MFKLDVNKIQQDFPQLAQKIRGKDLVYLDSAATSLKPKSVIDSVTLFNSQQIANVHRGAHFLADQATNLYEGAREKIAHFIKAKESREIVFVRGTTEAINLVAFSYGKKFIQDGDEIVVSELEHHANIVPWQMLAEEKQIQIRVLPINGDGEIDFAKLDEVITAKTKLVAITHCSNNFGTVVDVKRVIAKAKSVQAKVLVDGAQMVGKGAVDVQDLDCDFYAFSGHKMLAPFGVGVLYAKADVLDSMPPYQGGGSMIAKVCFSGTSYNEIPYRFEAGTPNVEGAVGLAQAIDYINSIGIEAIEAHEAELTEYALQKLKTVPGLKILGPEKNRKPIFSFIIEGVHHSDLGQLLDQMGIAIRCGHHCTQPLFEKLGLTGSARASFSIYNDKNDVDKLVGALIKAREMLL